MCLYQFNEFVSFPVTRAATSQCLGKREPIKFKFIDRKAAPTFPLLGSVVSLCHSKKKPWKLHGNYTRSLKR